jgi:G3E family GTPase
VPLPLVLSVGLFETDKYFDASGDKVESPKAHDHHDHAAHDHRDHDDASAHDEHDHSNCDHDHGHCEHDHDHDHGHDHGNHLEMDGFTSLSFASDRPFSVKRFQHFLDEQMPANVFRAKGILWFEESPKRHVFHLSGKRFSLDDEDWRGEPKNQLVLIGQDLDHDQLRSQIESCLTTASPHRGKGFGRK